MFDHLNRLSKSKLEEELMRCCASQRWIVEMVRRRPFHDDQSVSRIAEEIWWSLDELDWREAFAAHPRIGDVDSLREKFGQTRQWASSEQAGTRSASEETLRQLAEANAKYESKFGYLFIVCATEKTADNMLEILKNRLKNEPVDEIRIAAEEQLNIMQTRLRKLGS